MTPELRKALGRFEEVLDDAVTDLAEHITFNEFVEWFEDARIIDLW